ncbi:ribosome assembly RNA-binding protein YhbY [Pelosinus propionicus]|uniref:RNA-binding protein n=1 Tax=Pelosinus propionicus DSM 13327 TaxID=1123291 RepID=A0A1I4JR21_9FIRM|nr:ribosome assembly RNA-binding protein YhbY [Pelosinus propionicus]SFL68673.1 RNA-binding protein [Pelosinus propionicus DSM 13327]
MEEITTLTGKQKRYLRSLGSTMDPVVQIGKTGLSGSLLDSTKDALIARELIKVRVLQNCSDAPKEVITQLAEAADAQLVQVIGRNGLLYKRNRNPEKNHKIELPS